MDASIYLGYSEDSNPMIITRTPFRISFFGGGSDYPIWYREHGGAVLSAAINKYCYISCRNLPPFFDFKTRVVWSKIEVVKDHKEIQHPAVREALAWLNMNEGVEVTYNADLPARSGLGSSSSFSVGLLNGLYALQGKMVTKRQLALDAIHLEQVRLKENVGSQDQTAAAFGGFNKIEFGGAHEIAVRPMVVSAATSNNLQDHLLMFFTGMARTAHEVAAEQIKNTPKKGTEITAMAGMVDEAITILSKNASLEDFGRLLHEGWQLKRTLSSQITNTTIDDIYTAGRKAGALGGKLLGAGAGGFMLFFAPPERHPAIKQALAKFLHVPARFDHLGSQVIYYGPHSTLV